MNKQQQQRTTPNNNEYIFLWAKKTRIYCYFGALVVLVVWVFYQQSHLYHSVLLIPNNYAEQASLAAPLFHRKKGEGRGGSGLQQQVQVQQGQGQIAVPHRKWAYAFLVAGCSSLTKYRGFLTNVLVAAHVLRMSGTKADIVLMIQMSSHTNEERLPDEDEELLKAMNIQLKYIPKFQSKESETFYAIMLEKFRILDLVDYSRVLYLDSDIMPFCSLDYLFELSEPAIIVGNEDDESSLSSFQLKENIILAWFNEPASGGFFVLRPGKDEFSKLQHIIQKREEKAIKMKYEPYWDPIEGWGHIFQGYDKNDYYTLRNSNRVHSKNGTTWDWYGVAADQGLLYYWTKYIKNNVSIIIDETIENWGINPNRTAVATPTPTTTTTTAAAAKNMTTSMTGTTASVPILENKFHRLLSRFTCRDHTFVRKKESIIPKDDFKHFTGTSKPWVDPNFVPDKKVLLAKPYIDLKPNERWYIHLWMIEAKLHKTIDIIGTTTITDRKGLPDIGAFPAAEPMMAHILAKRDNHWNAYVTPS